MDETRESIEPTADSADIPAEDGLSTPSDVPDADAAPVDAAAEGAMETDADFAPPPSPDIPPEPEAVEPADRPAEHVQLMYPDAADVEADIDAATPEACVEADADAADETDDEVEEVLTASPEPAPADPWEAAGDDDGELTVPDDAVEPQPPAVAFAPAFLAVDDEGRPVADEAVEAIEQALNRPLPSLAPVKLEPDELAAPDEAAADEAARSNGSAIWTIPLICLGIAIIACCLLIPQADENRRLVWEREKLRRDLEQIQKQVDVNERFLEAMAEDVVLTQRLAQRQMNVVRAGTSVLALDVEQQFAATSPFHLTIVPPPEPMPAYVPYGGRFAALCRHPRTQLYLIGGALLCIASGVVLGRENPAGRAGQDIAGTRGTV